MTRESKLPPALRRALTVSALVVVATVGLYLGLFRLEVKPRVGFVPGWSFVDSSGERLTSEDLRGSLVLYTFTYAGQEDSRRQVLPILAEVQERLAVDPVEGVPVRLVAVFFDPAHDTPEVLAETARRFDADPEIWRFVTGSARTLEAIVRRGFEVWYEPADDGTFRSDPVFVLVDGWGIERERYRLGLPDPGRIVGDLRSVAREVRSATGPARLAYEAAHLFSCYSTV